jgi:DNA-binding response OmpR family regulator
MAPIERSAPSKYSNIYEFRTILIVDDDRELAEILQWTLAGENFLVDVVHDGNEAMKKVSSNNYDVIVCDILMPNLRGDDFYRQATEIRPALKNRFVFITGFGNDPEVRYFLSKSGVKSLLKPFPVKRLIDCVKELLAVPTSPCGKPSFASP